ncbi:hypothetical protein [Dokdonia donghaensis]|uniref:Lipocalin-like domain-containing protein n=1 Tax=Dokdonia donghaensis DSW-1 TaxID=1300343 RepID=A0A0A2GVE3_9FLAO|nr:hypothetical protein [Dokdonia donghaensis]ANH61686.1 hypothetical protein I597_2795 [Dokdonia donghaensis DSW-1]KGO06276.1 hypothetical protein NV36_05115 [Dokdonia donghaensis DSW-1]
MKKLVYTLIALLILSCSSSPQEKLANISGYWEIASIEMPDGTTRTYGMSQNIDFFEINEDGTGVRKKVQPNALGEFITSNDSENINTIIEDDILILSYTTALDNWQETVKKASKEELILINKDDIIYKYRRYQPLIIE